MQHLADGMIFLTELSWNGQLTALREQAAGKTFVLRQGFPDADMAESEQQTAQNLYATDFPDWDQVLQYYVVASDGGASMVQLADGRRLYPQLIELVILRNGRVLLDLCDPALDNLPLAKAVTAIRFDKGMTLLPPRQAVPNDDEVPSLPSNNIFDEDAGIDPVEDGQRAKGYMAVQQDSSPETHNKGLGEYLSDQLYFSGEGHLAHPLSQTRQSMTMWLMGRRPVSN